MKTTSTWTRLLPYRPRARCPHPSSLPFSRLSSRFSRKRKTSSFPSVLPRPASASRPLRARRRGGADEARSRACFLPWRTSSTSEITTGRHAAGGASSRFREHTSASIRCVLSLPARAVASGVAISPAVDLHYAVCLLYAYYMRTC